jgi:hypothetical protein
MTFWNTGATKCKLASGVRGIAAAGTGCTVDQTATQGAEETVVSAASPYIHFSTDLLAEVDEATVAVVVAHELGHYFRGHLSEAVRTKTNFWYRVDAARAGVAVPAADSASLSAAYTEVVQQGRSLGGYKFPSKYSPRLREFLVLGLAPILAARTEPGFACTAARKAIGPSIASVLGSEVPSEEARIGFLAFEGSLAGCAASLKLTGPGVSSISAGEVLFAASAHKPGPKVKISLNLGDSLGDLLGRLDKQAKDLDAKTVALEKRIRENRVGLYTTEQEADDFALEISTRLGLSAEQVLQGWIGFMTAIDKTYLASMGEERLRAYYKQTGEYDAPSCAKLLADNFTTAGADGTRVPVTMSLGQLDEPHHTSCYRLYNLAREARVRNYTLGAAQTELSPPWATLKAQAKTLSTSAP